MIKSLLFPNIPKWKYINLAEYAKEIKGNPLWRNELELEGTLYGGFLENRSPLFDERHITDRVIHLGVDYWVPENTKVLCPYDGIIVDATPCTKTKGGWGGRIDIQISGLIWIFGHLENPTLKVGKSIKAGDVIGIIAPKERNGFWHPHLHLQISSQENYDKYPIKRDMDAYAIPSENLYEEYKNPDNYPFFLIVFCPKY